jgi:hypothetical protein
MAAPSRRMDGVKERGFEYIPVKETPIKASCSMIVFDTFPRYPVSVYPAWRVPI